MLLSAAEAHLPILILLIVLCLAASRATAQTPVATDGPHGGITAGQRVWVTTLDGHEIEGRITSVSSNGVELREHHDQTLIRWSDIGAVEGPDRLVNGAVIGAIIGGLAGGVPMALFAGVYGECPCGGSSTSVAGLASLGAAIGAGVGALGDHLNGGRRDLYRRTPTVSIRPAVIPGHIGLSADVRW